MEEKVWIRFVASINGYDPGDIVQAERLRIESGALMVNLRNRLVSHQKWVIRLGTTSSGFTRFYEISEMEYLALVASGEINE